MTCFETFATKWRPTLSLSTIGGALILVSFAPTPALSQFWGQYQNPSFHYAIDIPPGFESSRANEDGTGAIYYRLDAEQVLSLWAGENALGIEAVAGAQAQELEAQGWVLGMNTSTPDWSALTAQRDHRISIERIIELCEPGQYAGFRMEFHIRDLASIEPVIEGLTRSFRPEGC